MNLKPDFKRALRWFGVLSFVLVVSAVTAQSPWVRSRAGFYAQAAWQIIPNYTELIVPSGQPVQAVNGRVGEQSFQIYGEYGFTRKWTGVLSLPYRWTYRTQENAGQFPDNTISGFGNTQLGVKRGFNAWELNEAISVITELPGSTRSENYGLQTGYDAYTLRPVLSIGKGKGRYYWYLYTSLGIRSNNYSHFLQSGGEAGVHFGRLWLMGFSEWMQSAKNGSRSLPSEQFRTGLFPDQQSWWSFGLKSVISTGRFTGIVLSATGAFAGENVANRPALAVGYFFRWD